MIFTAFADGQFVSPAGATRCALGRVGVIAAADKREGDGASPLGDWTMLRVLYRPDRGPEPKTGLPTAPIWPNDGWCDDPADPAYNRPVRLPYPARCEALWREDEVYDLICVLNHNDPPTPGLGSAIFLHRPGARRPARCPRPGYDRRASADRPLKERPDPPQGRTRQGEGEGGHGHERGIGVRALGSALSSLSLH
jgi:hypothetical protein